MPSQEDVDATKAARRMFGKRGVDCSTMDIRVSHGVCQVRGVVSLLKGADVGGGDVHTAVEQICNLLRRRPDIREVSVDVTYRTIGE
jgi:hypothetical protein